MKTGMILEVLTQEEKMLVLEEFFSQNYAKEIVASSLADLENGVLDDVKEKYLKLSNLYDRIANFT